MAPPSHPPLDLGILLGLGYQEFVRQLREHHAAEGFADLGSADGFVFRALADGPRTISDLAARLTVSKQGAAQIVDDMQRRGLVARTEDPADRRARPITLTDRGQAALATARAFHRDFQTRLAARFGDRRVADMRAILEDIAGADQVRDPRIRAHYV